MTFGKMGGGAKPRGGPLEPREDTLKPLLVAEDTLTPLLVTDDDDDDDDDIT